MRNLTEVFQHYRLCVRETWNRCFWADPALRHANSVEWFSKLKPLLFEALVVEKAAYLAPGLHWENLATTKLYFEVVPAVHRIATGSDAGALIILDSRPTGEKLVVAKEYVEASVVKLRFIDLFDWSGFTSYADLRYYLVSVDEFKAHPEWEGREALIDVAESEVYWREPTEESLSEKTEHRGN
jgi:hypothetical protein